MLALMAPVSGQQLENGLWTIDRIDMETVRLSGPDGASADFAMRFQVLRATKDPKPAKTKVAAVDYNGATSWVASVHDPASGIGGGDNKDWGDGFDPEVVTDPGRRTANLFSAAASKELRPANDKIGQNEIRYEFVSDASFAFSARLGFDAETGCPVLTTSLEAKDTGWFSVVYTGAPASAFADADEVWQPLVWQGRRFPS